MSQDSRTDPMTGILSRYGGTEFLMKMMAISRRLQNPLAIAMLDIDNFKETNETHGQLVGDSILRALADALTKTIRGADAACRWGGEEFLVILPDCDLTDARTFGERVCAAITQDLAAGKVPTTVSMGVSAFRAGDNVESLVQRADTQLLEAKKAGKNCVR